MKNMKINFDISFQTDKVFFEKTVEIFLRQIFG